MKRKVEDNDELALSDPFVCKLGKILEEEKSEEFKNCQSLFLRARGKPFQPTKEEQINAVRDIEQCLEQSLATDDMMCVVIGSVDCLLEHVTIPFVTRFYEYLDGIKVEDTSGYSADVVERVKREIPIIKLQYEVAFYRRLVSVWIEAHPHGFDVEIQKDCIIVKLQRHIVRKFMKK